jgi:hypothetical protein
MHSFMLIRHGRVIAEGWWAPYKAESPHELYSLSKSFTSTAVGLAVDDGKISVDDPVLKFFPEDAPAQPSSNLRSMRVRDLLTMTAGHQDESPVNEQVISTASFLAHPVPHKPGTHFKYNTPATYMLSAIVQKVTGKTVLEYLQPRLFEPLGIENPTWRTSTQGISLGGYGLRIRTEDIAKFGQLLLQEGVWEGRQLVPKSWVDAASSRQVSNGSNPDSDWEQGYGFQFWRCRHGAFRGDGAFGQYVVVLPDQDAVIAITSGVRDMQQVLNLIWDRLLPAFQSDTLAEDATQQKALADRLSNLALPTPKSFATRIQTPRDVRYVVPANDWGISAFRLRDAQEHEDVALEFEGIAGTELIRCGSGEWRPGRLASLFPGESIAASGAWTAPDTFTAAICAFETPFQTTLTFHFTGDAAVLEGERNVAFGSLKMPRLERRAERTH